MSVSRNLRGVAGKIFSAPAKFLLKLGVTANQVTIMGTLLTCSLALSLIPTGHLIWGALLITLSGFADTLDGVMARMSETTSEFGAFLDSSLDRFVDGSIFGGILAWAWIQQEPLVGLGALTCLVFGSIVPYIRARGESFGVVATVGLAERADRLFITIAALLLVGLGGPPLILAIALIAVASASFVTSIQRIVFIKKALDSR